MKLALHLGLALCLSASAADDETTLCRDKDGPLLTMSWGHNPLNHMVIEEHPQFPSITCSVHLSANPRKSEMKEYKTFCEKTLRRYGPLMNKCSGASFDVSRFEKLRTETILHCWEGDACTFTVKAVLADQPDMPSNQPLHPTPTAAEAPASGAGERRR